MQILATFFLSKIDRKFCNFRFFRQKSTEFCLQKCWLEISILAKNATFVYSSKIHINASQKSKCSKIQISATFLLFFKHRNIGQKSQIWLRNENFQKLKQFMKPFLLEFRIKNLSYIFGSKIFNVGILPQSGYSNGPKIYVIYSCKYF